MRKILHLLTQCSVGKKYVMSATGLGAVGFLLGHLGGNLFVYGGEEAINAYAHHLHSIPVLPAIELGLAALFTIHVAYGIMLTLQNWAARPTGYAMAKWGGGRTVSSATMVYSGLVVLLFLGLHVFGMKGEWAGAPASDKIAGILSSGFFALCYVVGIVALGFHLYHGAASTLQSLGLRHPAYNQAILLVGKVLAVILTIGFASFPLLFQIAPGFFGSKGGPVG